MGSNPMWLCPYKKKRNLDRKTPGERYVTMKAGDVSTAQTTPRICSKSTEAKREKHRTDSLAQPSEGTKRADIWSLNV